MQHRDAANLLREIVTARAERLRYAGAELMDPNSYLLRSGPRRSYNPNRTAANNIGKTKGHAIDDRGATIRAHYHQVMLVSVGLQCKFAVSRYVVTEEHHIHAKPQRFHRLCGC